MASRPIPPDRIGDPRDATVGLTSAQVAERRALYGFNDVLAHGRSGWMTLLNDTARDPMLWFLVGMSVLFVVIGDYTEAAVLGVAVVPLIGMDAYLHRRTQSSTAALSSRLAAQARVIRDGVSVVLPAREAVPADLVNVAPGESFPADGLIVGGVDLQVDESSLTGEAWPVRKRSLTAQDGVAPANADLVHWVFAGTRLLTGQARMRIVTIGGETLYGEIVRSAMIGAHGQTPLQKAIGRLVGIMLAGALALCVALAAIRLMQGHGLFDAFLSAATLAIAALPEEFPVVFTFFLGVGVYRLARRQALVRRAVAVENIGRVSCICSDKTGTLTEGALTLAHLEPAAALTEPELRSWAAAASRADSGDPLDAALIAAAPGETPPRRIATFPFTEDRRRETAILAREGGGATAVTKGAPETIFGLCAESGASLDSWRAKAADYAAQGHKVIAVATRALSGDTPPADEPSEGFALAGLLALEDPLREGVRDAVLACRDAGIRVIMITGDHPATAGAIAREAGLGGETPRVALADDLFPTGKDGAVDMSADIDVVARAAPGQKLRLVEALRAAGEIVAVTGDGVNDVPALQRADVGIAMGERGTQSAREVAAIVLLDDNFRTIVRAIGEGRQLFRNLQLSFAYILMVHIPLVLTAAAIPLAGHPLLYLPIHVVWLELIIHPTALLVFQDLPTSDRLLPGYGGGPPRFFGPRAWAVITVSGLLLAAMIYIGFESALGPDNRVEHARALALGALIAASAGTTATLSGLRTWTARIVSGASVVSLVALVQTPVLARLVTLEPLHLDDWARVAVAGAAAGVFALVVKGALTERAPKPA